MKRNSVCIAGSALLLAVIASACDSSSPASPSSSPSSSPGSPSDTSTSDPPDTKQPKATTRVDLEQPTFSDPTALTNRFFAINDVDQMVQLGAEGPDKLRFEVTLLPRTKMVVLDGQQVETRVHQFVAYSNGRILEVAVDFYAQADDGSVWYLGENVDNYTDGVIADHEGEWLAGRDGPPGMIMPADPQVGDVYRPENIPGLVFEEVTVKSVGETVEGPQGPVSDAVFIQERLQDGTLEDKVFAPGYGEFQAEVKVEKELYAAAVAVPTDAVQGPTPQELSTLGTGAERLFDRAGHASDSEVTKAVAIMTAAWDSYEATDVPPLLAAQMDDALVALSTAAETGATHKLGQAALDVRRAGLDIELRYGAPVDVDGPRLKVWAQQLQLDTRAAGQAEVLGDVAVLETIWNRVRHAVEPKTAHDIARALADLHSAANADNLPQAARLAASIQQSLTSLT